MSKPIYTIEPTENGFIVTVERKENKDDVINEAMNRVQDMVTSAMTGFDVRRETYEKGKEKVEPLVQKHVFKNYTELQGFLRLYLD